SVPEELIRRVRHWIDLPLIVGGGIRSPEEAAEKVKAGADFIVVGTAFDDGISSKIINQYTSAIHEAGRQRKSL
ncbi:MAG TPA: geranylgeranylglyceryl/heptaprenylglyceryl phosphate synthase, partial [bacterium]